MHNVNVSSRSSSYIPTIFYKPWYSPLWCQAITPVLSDFDFICLYALIVLHVPGGPLARYVKLQVVHGPGMPGTFSSLPRVSDPNMHHGTCDAPMNSPHTVQWRGALMFSFICAWINGWVNNHEAGDLGRYRAHYDVIVMRMYAPASVCLLLSASTTCFIIWFYQTAIHINSL